VTPYLRAFHLYHAHGPPVHTWTTALDFHLQHGAVLSLPQFFLMARPVPADAPAEAQLDLANLHTPPEADTWHIWALAGDLRAALQYARLHQVRTVTYQRRNQPRLHTLRLPHALLRPSSAARSQGRQG
jgi:hypothetical protein